jgi:siroheme synthase
MPAAVVQSATTAEQRVLVSTLARIAEEAVANGFGSPSIVAIGEIVRLRAALLPLAVALADGV